MTEVWLNDRLVARMCGVLVAVQLVVAALNAAFIPAERNLYLAWQNHLEAPENVAPAPAARPTAKPSLRVDFLRYMKEQLDLDRECNFTTWFSSMQCALTALVLFFLYVVTRRREWLLLMLGFVYLSFDELCQFHEWFGGFLTRSGVHVGALGGPYPWIVFLGPIFLVYGIGVVLFLRRELAAFPTLRAYAIAGVVLMASSLPLEAIGGQLQGSSPRPPRWEVIAEETCESLGETALLYAMLLLLGRRLARDEGRPRR